MSDAHQPDEPLRLTDGTTDYWGRIFPKLWSGVVAVLVALIWMDLLGDAPAPEAVKWAALGIWGGLSTLFFKLFGGLRHVWLDGDHLVVGDLRRGPRIDLRSVREVKESRFQQVKMVTLRLDHPTPVGNELRFVPRGAKTFFLPASSSPVAETLRARREALLLPEGSDGRRGRRPPRGGSADRPGPEGTRPREAGTT